MQLPGPARHWFRRAEGSDWADHAVRAGLVVYGLVSLTVASLAVRLAVGDRSQDVSSKGALREVAGAPFGGALLVAVALGMGLLVLWRVVEALGDYDGAGGGELWRRRGASLLKAGIYAVLGFSAAKLAIGDTSGQNTQTMTGRLLALPFGPWLVVAVAVAVAAYGVAQMRTGLSEDHLDKLAHEGRTGDTGRLYRWLGKIGYVAKGAVMLVIGGFLGWAGLTTDADKSAGMDQAFGRVLTQPFGPVLVLATGAGLACYGLFTLARARHLSR